MFERLASQHEEEEEHQEELMLPLMCVLMWILKKSHTCVYFVWKIFCKSIIFLNQTMKNQSIKCFFL